MALPTNNRLGWKGLPWTNTLAYYENSEIAAVKIFYNIGSRKGEVLMAFASFNSKQKHFLDR
jgi:hypothetical protein